MLDSRKNNTPFSCPMTEDLTTHKTEHHCVEVQAKRPLKHFETICSLQAHTHAILLADHLHIYKFSVAHLWQQYHSKGGCGRVGGERYKFKVCDSPFVLKNTLLLNVNFSMSMLTIANGALFKLKSKHQYSKRHTHTNT